MEKLKDKIQWWQSQGLTRDCASCKSLSQEASNTKKCGLPCKVTTEFQERLLTKEINSRLSILNNGGKIEL